MSDESNEDESDAMFSNEYFQKYPSTWPVRDYSQHKEIAYLH